VDAEQVAAWVAEYQRAWRTAGTGLLAGLFAADASYRQAPYAEPVRGLAAIARMWEAERAGPDEVFRMTSSVLAADGDTAVVRAEVWYGDPVREEFRELWVLRFGAGGLCTEFEEWPFWPEAASQPPDS
jgi:hypothetical protein